MCRISFSALGESIYYNSRREYLQQLSERVATTTLGESGYYNFLEIFGNISSLQVAKVPSRIFLRAVVTRSR